MAAIAALFFQELMETELPRQLSIIQAVHRLGQEQSILHGCYIGESCKIFAEDGQVSENIGWWNHRRNAMRGCVSRFT